jgi:tetratricopeptide (TPR) repeat protein
MFSSKSFSRLGRRLRSWRRYLSFRSLSSVGRFFGKPLVAGARRMRVWFHTRSFRLFLQGLPALLVGVGVITLLVFSQVTPQEQLQLRYLEQGRAAFQGKDFALAQVCFDRACQTAGDRPDVAYEAALTAEALKQLERAAVLMGQLAPDGKKGYGEAHVWRAGDLLRDVGRDPFAPEKAKTHLIHALRGELRDPNTARALLGRLYLASGDLDKAEIFLRQVVDTQPHMRLLLADLYRRRGDVGRARHEATIMAGIIRPLLKADVYDRWARGHLANALLFLEQFQEAINLLGEGWALTGDPAYRKAIGGAYATWYGIRVRDEKAGKDDRAGKGNRPVPSLVLLERGLSWDPTNQGLLQRLLDMIRDGADGERVRDTLRGALAKGQSPATTHFVLGLHAFQRGNEAEARLHWERSYQLAPHVTDVLNNLAVLLARPTPPAVAALGAETLGLLGTPLGQGPVHAAAALWPGRVNIPDLPRALQLIDLAVKQVPGNPAYRDTRGAVYLRMGRWKEALAEFEAALPAMPESPSLHAALAEVYERLGSPAMAAKHRRLAAKKPQRAGG